MKKRDVCAKFYTYVFISVMADMKPFRTVHTMYHMMHTMYHMMHAMYHMMHSMYHRLTVYRRGGVRRSPQVEEEEYTITMIFKLAQLCFIKKNGQHSYKQTLCFMKTQRLLWKENTLILTKKFLKVTLSKCSRFWSTTFFYLWRTCFLKDNWYLYVFPF